MLDIFIPENELYDSERRVFIKIKPVTLRMEHSLVSLYKWEAKFHKPFLESDKTPAEMLEYFKCMTVNKNLDPVYFNFLTSDDVLMIDSYMNESMTATTISNVPNKGKGETWTAELIYYYMIVNGIPIECQKWHLNQLFTLIRVCSVKNGPQEKMSKSEIMRQNKELNAARLKKYNTKG